MKICLTWKIIVCVLLCVFPVDIKGQTCQCSNGNDRECKSCNVGCYLVSNYWCFKCPQKCYSCSSINHCDVCKTGYYGPRCDHDCISCRNGSCANNTCTDGCADGHYYDGYCRPCLKKCVTCNSYYDCPSCIAGRTGSYCQNCKDGYYPTTDGYCQQCRDKCVTCNSYNYCPSCIAGRTGSYCQNCKDGYYQTKDGHCQQCPDKCVTCNSYDYCPSCIAGRTGSYCQNCKDGYYHTKDGNCQQCRDKCVTCNSYTDCQSCIAGRTGSFCQNCKDGYYHTKDGHCQQCRDKCVTCNNNNYCTSCIAGRTGSYCQNCKDGYYHTKDGHCQQCRDKCVTCNSYDYCSSCKAGRTGSNCQNCKDGYYHTKYGHCQQCRDMCVTCNSYDDCPSCIAGRTGSYCQNCRDGYYHYNGQCLPCNTNCLHGKCNVYNGECTDGCKYGWSGLTCQDACAPSCYSCERYDTSTCSSCSLDHYGTSCERECSSNCVAKDDLRQCSFHNGDCNYGCVDDWTGSKCTEKCDMNCISCDAKDKAICHTCRPRFYGKSCENQCSLNCVKTVDIRQCRKSDGQCTDGCVEGWTGSMCTEQCAANCTSCNRWNETACTSCKPGYYGPSCYIECSEYCGNMNNGSKQCQQDDGTCLADCVTGYKGDKCDVPCDAGCRSSCDRNTGVCQPCRPAYFGPSCQHLCNVTCYDPGNGSNVCHQLSGECLFDCSQLLCSLDGGTQDAQTSDSVAVIGGAVGSAVMIVLVIAAVLVFMFLRKRRRKMSDPERRVTYDNSVNIEDDIVYSVPDKKRSVNKNVDKTQSTAHSTLPKLTPSKKPVTHGDVIYGNVGDVPVIPSRLGVDDPEDNVEGLCEDVAKSGDLKDDNVYSVPDKERSVYKNVDKTQSTGHSTLPKLTPSKEAVTHGDVIYGNVGALPEIPFRLGVDEPEDNVEELCEDVAKSEDLKDGDATNAENYYNIYGLTRTRVQVDTLRDHVTSISMEDFEKEFQKLPKGLTRPYDDAVKPTNVSKNRYKGIYPYDSTRVKLIGNRGDYINASYIQGFEESEKTYIASSGPTDKFMKGYVEFWEMVWQEKVDKIVMLTNFMEESKMKCEKYWPDVGEHNTYGDINVHCVNDERYADFTVTKLTMKKDSQVSSIHHFHFTAWPDRGTPENVVSLVEFRESVEHVPKITEGPTIVHCSAGIGRTGTHIALDILTREGRSDKYVDVYGCVLGLRGQRVLMVQNVEQYRFLHYALSHSLTNKCDQIASKDFCTVNTDEIQEQFQLLGTINVLNGDEEKKAIEKNKKEKHKNRKGASIPGDSHRPRLFKYNQNSKSDYINAVYVDGYKEKNRYIIAQTPLSRTVEDFLGLVLQENCSCIISLDPVGITSKQDIGDYLPDVNQELSVGKVKVSCVQRETTPEYILSKLTVGVQEVSAEEPKTILHYQYTEWPEESAIPSSTGSFLNLIRDSGRTVREPNMPLQPVLIHCLTGGDRSSLFPVVANLLEKINSEQQASVVNVVSQVRARRSRAISNKEQFKYCYELASLSVENNSVYSNLL